MYGTTPAYTIDDFPSPDAPVINAILFSSNSLTICLICKSLPLKKMLSSSVKGLKPGYGQMPLLIV